MKIIVGLGNPGEKYKTTRHNAGFLALDFILNDADDFMEAKPGNQFKSEMYTWEKDGNKVIFLKPQTYMNDSGQALKVICNFYKLDLKTDLLIIHDDVDLPFGSLRVSDNVSAAGHNGVQSIIDNLSTQDFKRLRLGIEARASREEMPTENFVLQNFSGSELQQLQADVFPKVKLEIQQFLAK